MACLKTVVLLLDRFQLSALENPSEEDAFNVRSRLFYRYFQFFVRVIRQCFEKVSNFVTIPAVNLLNLWKFPLGDERGQVCFFIVDYACITC